MEGIKRHRLSRRGYRSHLTRILNATSAIIEKEPSELTESDFASLTDWQRQLDRKKDILADVDVKIIALIVDDEELEEEILEAEGTQETISQQAAQIDRVLRLYRRTHPDPNAVVAGVTLPQVPTLEANSESSTSSETVSILATDDPPNASANSELPITVVPPVTTHPTSHVVIPPESHETTHPTSHVVIPPESHVITPSASNVASPPTNHSLTSSGATTRLPKLNIPVFSGEALQWQSFWDCFEAAVHDNPSLTSVQKLNYLRAQLQHDAARVVAGFPLTGVNYEHSVTLLRQRYGQPHKLISAHMNALLEMHIPTNSSSALQLFYDSIESHTRSLSSLGKTRETYGSLLVPIILNKLPADVRKSLARQHGSDIWTIDELQGALLNEIRILEMGSNHLLKGQPNSPQFTAAFHTNSIRKTSTTTSGAQTQKKATCVYCKGPHASGTCEVIKDHQKRLDMIKQEKLCFNCLGHHKVSNCNSKYRCRKCGRKHHTSICGGASTDNATPPAQPPTPASQTMRNTNATNPATSLAALTYPPLHNVHVKGKTCLLKTAVATITFSNVETKANILFDEGSQRSFITQELADSLLLKPHKMEDISLAAFGASQSHYKSMAVATVNVKTQSKEYVPISVLVVPTIAVPLKLSATSKVRTLPYLQGLQLAHPVIIDGDFNISLLIGADHYWDIVEDHIVRGDGPTATSSKIGYLLSGPVSHTQSLNVVTSTLQISTQLDDDHNIQKFYDLETTGIIKENNSDKHFLQEYSQTCITHLPDGSYCARFPWKESHPPLPTNSNVCKRRTRSLALRLSLTPNLLQTYNNIICDQLNRGFIERVYTPEQPGLTHFIPHHCVKKNSITTPIRIVYDCSCRQTKDHPSLNDCLLTGPHFLTDLCSIILRFRTHNYAISTDIEKAFLHIHLHESDRDYTRFLWLSDATDPTSELIMYRFKTVLFGAVSSPFMLYATLYRHLQCYNTPLSHDIQANLYVDNIVSGCETELAAIQYYNHARLIMSKAKFNLRSWVSNSPQLNLITHQENTADSTVLANVLGIHWDTNTDKVSLIPKTTTLATVHLITKREVLQDSSKVFDPLGLAVPVTIRAKLLMQTLWQKHLEWDEPLEPELCEQWHSIITDIKKLPQLHINRRYFSVTYEKHNVQLHLFADASTKAYGAVAFLRLRQESSFVMAKTRVAPLKRPTLPRLELMAALTASHLAKFIIDSLQLHDTPVFIWTDSQIVLHWVHSKKTLPQFVSSRVTEIHNVLPSASWRFCSTNDNPADLLTRGITYDQLQSSLMWLNGPSWLLSDNLWPEWQPTKALQLQVSLVEAKETAQPEILSTTSMADTGLHCIFDVSAYHSLSQLLNVTAYVFRFVRNIRKPSIKYSGPISPAERTQANLQWIHTVQQQSFPAEIKNINSQSNRSPLVRQLRLFIDKGGLIRCGGRIHNAPVSELVKFPYLLPAKHLFTKLTVYAVHEKYLHAGVNSTLTAIRQSYWIPSARQLIRKLLRQCVICRKTEGKPYQMPDPPPLVKCRVQQTQPFEVTGVDFTGALYVRDMGKESKVYVCLFTCAVTRAVHLEIVTNLTTENFLQAFRRFSSRKSLPKVMLSDNASTYLAAVDELNELFSCKTLLEVLSRKGVTWKFIPKRAPWFGGFWERLVGLTKASLKKVLGRSYVSLLDLQTIIVEIEAILNDRPLTYVSPDLKDPEPLTPAHLLYGRRIVSLPHPMIEGEVIDDPDYGSNSQVKGRAGTMTLLLNRFWRRWRAEYLTSLREFHRTTGNNSQNVKKGDIVLVHDDTPRAGWKLAIIEEVITGHDGHIRAVNIRTSSGRTNRPISRLYPLEINSEADTEHVNADVTSIQENSNPSSQQNSQIQDIRPTRQAAMKAHARVAEWTSVLRGPPEDVDD